jgi:hypothetical protein
VRPRGWHLPEKHVLVDGEPMSGALFDFGLFFFHNAKELTARGTGPFGRAQLRPLGLHPQLHQEIRRGPRLRHAGPGASHNDEPLPAKLQPVADQDLPPPGNPRNGRDGRADPDPRRPRRKRSGDGEGPRRQAAGGRRRARWHLGCASGLGRDRQGGLRPQDAAAQPDRPQAAGRPRHGLGSSRGAGGNDHRGRTQGRTSMSGSATSRPGCAASAACRSTI